MVKRVFIREGNVVHATSSDRDDSLGAYLQRTGKITAEQFAETMVAALATPTSATASC